MTITQKQIIALAVEAGFDDIAPWLDADNVEQGQIDAANRWIERMTAFVMAAYQRGVLDERNACLAEIETGIWLDKTTEEVLADIAEAIRARRTETKDR